MRPRVLHVAAWYPSEDDPTFGIFVRRYVTAAAITSDGALVHTRLQGGGRTEGGTEIAGEPLTSVRLDAARSPLGLWSATRKLGDVMRRLESAGRPFDLIHSHVVTAAVPAAVVARRAGLSLVHTEHWSRFTSAGGGLPPAARPLARWALHRADQVLPVSATLAEGVRSVAPRAAIRVLPNPVDTSVFRPAARSSTGAPTVITASRLTALKRVDILLRAFSRVREALPDTRLVVAGDGPARFDLEATADRLGLATCVEFVGEVSPSELAALMRRSSVFALASRHETFSVVCAEALASGVPVVATRCGGPEEFVDEASGILVPVDEPDALADGIITALRRDWDAASLASYARSRFSFDVVGAQLREVYEEVLGARR